MTTDSCQSLKNSLQTPPLASVSFPFVFKSKHLTA